MNELSREQRARRRLREQDCILKKSRVKNIHHDNMGGYMILNMDNTVVLGGRYELSLDAVESYLAG